MYMALVDPHLTHGADVCPDYSKVATADLERSQNLYLRRMLRVGDRCSTVALFTESGILPIRYRRADLLVRFLGYLLQRPPDCYVRAALRDSLALAEAGRPSWIGDVRRALALLLVPLDLGAVSDGLDIDLKREEIKAAMLAHLESALAENGKLELLRARPSAGVLCAADWKPAPIIRFREYLEIKIPAHRTALTRLLLSEHGLAIERLRWEGYDRKDRRCRFCRDAVEDPQHALFVCEGSVELVDRRRAFWRAVLAADEALLPILLGLDMAQMIGVLCVRERAVRWLAQYVRDVLRMFAAVPLYRVAIVAAG